MGKLFSQPMGKRGSFNMQAVIGSIVGFIVLFLLLAQLVPEGQAAGNTLNQSGVPLGSLFASSGVLWLVLMAAVLIGAIYVAQRAFGGK